MTRRMAISQTAYSADFNGVKHAIAEKNYGTMSGPRILASAAALFIGGFSIYTALHYLPALLKPQAVMADVPMSVEDADAIETSRYGPVLGPYIEKFKIRRTYLKAGQTIQALYVLPQGATLDLSIRQCTRFWLVEVYACRTLRTENIRVENSTFGVRDLRFTEAGFYHFDQHVTLPTDDADYRIIWSRH